MKLNYYVRTCLMNNNAGDIQLNKKIFEHFKKETPRFINTKSISGDNYLLAGSILQWVDKNSIVCGTGFLSSGGKVKEKPKKILAVRGKLTRQKLLDQGIDCPENYGDPGLLLSKMYPKPEPFEKWQLGIIPHYVDYDSKTVENLAKQSIFIINILDPLPSIIYQINQCERIISSSLHGLIFADSYGIPNKWVKLSDKIKGNGFKYRDYFSSCGREDTNPIEIDVNTKAKDIHKRFSGDCQFDFDFDKLYRTLESL